LDITVDKPPGLFFVVPHDQLSLAIGKRGQNARLASRLLGWVLTSRRCRLSGAKRPRRMAKKVPVLALPGTGRADDGASTVEGDADAQVDAACRRFVMTGFGTGQKNEDGCQQRNDST
jgi:hypothetical protein